uniref:Ig-like domain-containing protein n=1 Tax=Oncorhynchus mykiss TaxID=8022 RepID=A0A8C7P3U8_ONCMY
MLFWYGIVLLLSTLSFYEPKHIILQGEAVDQQSGHVTALEGGLVTLSCNYTSSSTSPDLFWYIQLTRNSPQYVLRRDRYSEGSNNANSKSVPLTIQRVQLSDSARYYCALKPTVTTGDTTPLQKHTELHIDNTPVCTVLNTSLKLTQ